MKNILKRILNWLTFNREKYFFQKLHEEEERYEEIRIEQEGTKEVKPNKTAKMINEGLSKRLKQFGFGQVDCCLNCSKTDSKHPIESFLQEKYQNNLTHCTTHGCYVVKNYHCTQHESQKEEIIPEEEFDTKKYYNQSQLR